MISERLDQKTPNGGDYAIAYYLDGNRESTDKARAVEVEIVEYTTGGEIVFRTYMSVTETELQ
jgi:hypothetical protein